MSETTPASPELVFPTFDAWRAAWDEIARFHGSELPDPDQRIANVLALWQARISEESATAHRQHSGCERSVTSPTGNVGKIGLILTGLTVPTPQWMSESERLADLVQGLEDNRQGPRCLGKEDNRGAESLFMHRQNEWRIKSDSVPDCWPWLRLWLRASRVRSQWLPVPTGRQPP